MTPFLIYMSANVILSVLNLTLQTDKDCIVSWK